MRMLRLALCESRHLVAVCDYAIEFDIEETRVSYQPIIHSGVRLS
jgi:hypothetical protein